MKAKNVLPVPRASSLAHMVAMALGLHQVDPRHPRARMHALIKPEGGRVRVTLNGYSPRSLTFDSTALAEVFLAELETVALGWDLRIITSIDIED